MTIDKLGRHVSSRHFDKCLKLQEDDSYQVNNKRIRNVHLPKDLDDALSLRSVLILFIYPIYRDILLLNKKPTLSQEGFLAHWIDSVNIELQGIHHEVLRSFFGEIVEVLIKNKQ